MGLSGAKKKNKISRDPNNNNWSSSTERFGHRMLTSQGWTPGSYLGAMDAAQSEHFTAANASHIRILLKDDNLGLGAKRGAKADTFGLSTLQGIFGRLNGKSDTELVKEEKVHRDAELALYQGQRWGHVQFVSGGFLVGDSMEKRSSKTKKPSVGNAGAEPEATASSKKRKREDALADASEPKRSKKTKAADAHCALLPSDASVSAPPLDDESADTTTNPEKQITGRDLLDKARRKEERRRRKAEKAQRKAEREARRAAKALKKQKRKAGEDEDTTTTSPLVGAKEEPPDRAIESPISVPAKAPFGRHAVRSRYIRQKRMALMDAKALNEILMIKAQG